MSGGTTDKGYQAGLSIGKFWDEFLPIPDANMYGFFSNFRRKIPDLTKSTWSQKFADTQVDKTHNTVRKHVKETQIIHLKTLILSFKIIFI